MAVRDRPPFRADHVGSLLLTAEPQWAKLRLIVEVAEVVWGV